MDLSAWMLAAIVLVPFVATIFVLLLSSRPDAREGVQLAAAVITALLCALAIPSAFAPLHLATAPLQILPGLDIRFTADPLGLLFATLASVLWIITTVYNIGYMRGLKEHSQTRYYAMFALTMGAVMGVALSSNMFSLFVFYEILAITAYPLVVHKETAEALAAGRKYLIYTQCGGVAILAGIMAVIGMGNTLEFIPGGNPGIAAIAPEFARLAFLLLFFGLGVKAALVPLHGWLPSAMVAPTPVSGLLHAVAVVNTGVFGILRLMWYLYGPDQVLALGLHDIVIGSAVVTIVIGSLLALRQDDFKLRLAYSTVSQLSYMVLGAAILLPAGMSAASDAGRVAAVIEATYAFTAHALGKLTMFFVAGTVAVEAGKTKISELDGIGKKMPWEFAAFTLAALSMAGLPPMAGFIAKWYLALGTSAGDTGQWWLLLVIIGVSVLNLAYFLPIVIRAFYRPGDPEVPGVRLTLRGPVVVTAVLTALAGLWTVLPLSPYALSVSVATEVTRAAVPGIVTFAAGTAIPPFVIFLIGAPIVLFLRGRARQAGLAALGAIALLDVLLLPGGYFSGSAAGVVTQWSVPFMGYTLTLLRVDSLSYLTGVVFAIITFLAILYAAAVAAPRLHFYALLYAGTSLGAVFAGDWITLLFFWELMAVTSTFLIWQEGGEAIGAGYRYLLYHGLGGTLLMAGIALLIMGGGSPVVGPLAGIPGGPYQLWASVLIVLGIGVNIAFIPLHTWLPDAYPRANFAASVFLSVYTTKAAVYLLARAQPGTEFIAFMGAIMAVYGVAFAIFQNDMRRLLSYHIVSQVGYMVAGIGILGWLGAADAIGQLGLDGGMAHLFNHILYKALLFMAVGVIVWKTGENLLSRVGGLGKKMPVTAIAFWVAAFSIAGVPLFNGFVSKGMVLVAAEHTSLLLWILLEIASFGTFLSFLKLGYFAFIREGATEASDPPLLMQAAMLGTAALCIIIGIFPGLLYAILPASTTYAAYDMAHVLSAVLVLGAAALFFFTVGRKVLEPHDVPVRDFDLLYEEACHAVCSAARGIQESFRIIYGFATTGARLLFAAGAMAMGMENRDANWNIAMVVAVIVGLVTVVILGAGP
ncbi:MULTISPECIES: Na(+)/H(+) antiporter subunit D [unclassified Methanoregula]|uniref:Na(+)/H(+) antiporter subunit D n=1 Tax=unclassified Methanoregula TaxID=2649730 RepID=UPI0009CBD6C3|nr:MULTISPECIES: Na(+)/H(+) antiporter subunit D [unclassified Methanoregula]OPX64266.1 MAG: F(420)H(2) dehydrogenase subunit L [Methanoregula sp. PtaB.Bin085]OPY33609.1 MAG: F(420)H(2) dehydrogenase subunit L [Methanoregula sp. PtaU1.Bin006]